MLADLGQKNELAAGMGALSTAAAVSHVQRGNQCSDQRSRGLLINSAPTVIKGHHDAFLSSGLFQSGGLTSLYS